jgi:AraC family transcriptional regulator of adaptative response/methylated-DNA-[protein]-cysteine methyltransferase
MNDYERVAHMIRYLDAHHEAQPGLAELAACIGLSPHHFHRLFSRWAAITPKDFLQCLTLAHARELLAHGHSVLDSALGAGLSGPGRLHDLCVSLEAATPGEWRTGGAGWTITAGFASSPFGRCLLAEGPRGICHLAFVDASGGKEAYARLREQWPEARLQRADAGAAALAQRIFCKPGMVHAGPPLRAYVRGTAFQIRVWQALLQLPAGALASYGHVAAAIGRSGAARAVGTAVGSNPLAWLIPCHRVIRETGVLGSYRWGAVRKRAMLVWEAAPTQANMQRGLALGRQAGTVLRP